MSTVPAQALQTIDPVDAARTAERVTLDPHAVLIAEQGWRRTYTSLLRGAGPNAKRPKAIVRDRYSIIRRLSEEARRLIQTSTAPDDVAVLYAIDPHLITSYCEYWNDSKFQNFDFLSTEWGKDEQDKRVEFRTYLLSSILRISNLICLEEGRVELGHHVAFYNNYDAENASIDTATQVAEVEKALKQIEATARASEHLNLPKEDISKFIWNQFSALVSAAGIPEMQQRLASARLSQVLGGRHMKGKFFALRDAAKRDQDPVNAIARVNRAEALFQRISRNPDQFRTARDSFFRAYSSYLDIVSGADPENDVAGAASMSSLGNHANMNALFELHLLNTCLSECGASARIKYITDSAPIYDFVAHFPPDGVNVELVHPRHVFIFENKLTPENLARYQHLLSNQSAVIPSIRTGNQITQEHIDEFEDTFRDLIREFRSTYVFAPISESHNREAIARAIIGFGAEHDVPGTGRMLEILSHIADSLKSASDAVFSEYSKVAEDRFNYNYGVYRTFSRDINHVTGRTHLLVRSFGAEPSAVPEDSVPRLVCIPTSGKYRNIFKIYNTTAINHIYRKYYGAVQAVSLSDILVAVEKVISAPSSEKADALSNEEREAVTLLYFMRAIYAASDREWMLASMFTEKAAELLALAEPLATTSATLPLGNTPEGRRQLMAQEIFLLQHFARRGVASSMERAARRRRWLKLAARDLHASATATQSIDDSRSFSTAWNPNTVRQALTAAALLIEWAALRTSRLEAGRPIKLDGEETPLLPVAASDDVAWRELDMAGRTLESYWSDPEAVAKITRDVEILLERIEITARDVASRAKAKPEQPLRREPPQSSADGAADEHSAEFWRYIYIKAISCRLLIALAHKLGALGDAKIDELTYVDLMQYREDIEEHVEFAEQKWPLDSVSEPSDHVQNPFTRFLSQALLYIHEIENSHFPDIETEVTLTLDLLLMKRMHYELSDFGFPRSISQRFFSKYGARAANSLRKVANELAAEAHPDARLH